MVKMKQYPLVSVNIRTLNSAKTLRETLLSVKNQTYKNLEIVISDSHSKDDSLRIAKEYGASINFSDTLGDARHQNYEHSKGEYIFSVDSDQILDKKLIETCVDACRSKNANALVIAEKSIPSNNDTLLEKLLSYDKWVIDQNKDADAVFGTVCPRFFEKKILENVQWPKGLIIFDDTILYMELLKHGAKVVYISNQFIRHHEVNSWFIFFKKFYRYGKGYFKALKKNPTAVGAHSLPRRSYFSKISLSRPHYFLGLLLLYLIKVSAAGSGAFFYLINSFSKKLFKK